MLYQCGVREELLGKVCMIEREILNGLCWSSEYVGREYLWSM